MSIESLRLALQHIQDADACLLGINMGNRQQNNISKAMEFHRQAVRILFELVEGEVVQ